MGGTHYLFWFAFRILGFSLALLIKSPNSELRMALKSRFAFRVSNLSSSSNLRTPNFEWLSNRILRISLLLSSDPQVPNSKFRMASNRISRISLFSPWTLKFRTPNSEHPTANTTSELSFRNNLDRRFLCSLLRNRPSGLNLCTFH